MKRGWRQYATSGREEETEERRSVYRPGNRPWKNNPTAIVGKPGILTMPTKLAAALIGHAQDGNNILRFLGEAAYLWSYFGQLDKAAAIFQALITLAPNDPVGHQGLAEIYLSQGKYRQAEQQADLAARSSGADRRSTAFAYKLRGRALLQLNRLRDAEKSLLRAAQIDPGGIEGRSALEILEAARRMGIFPAGATPPVQ
jgi:tetratricopeptide (TPR) repeat protein